MTRCETCGHKLRKPPFDIERARTLAEDGLSVGQIAERLSKNYSTVAKHLKHHSIPVVRQTKFSDKDAMALAERGLTVSEMARQLGVTQACISKWKKRTGATITMHSYAPNPNAQAMCELYEAGTRAQQIAERFGVSYQRVYQILKDNQIKTRGRGPALTK